MDYQSVCLKDCMEIREIVSLHYFQYRSDFYFPGETHPFWEFVCVDAGEITVEAGEETHLLKKGDILFGSIRPYLYKAGFAPCDGVVAGTVHSFKTKSMQDYNYSLLTISKNTFFEYAINVSSGTKMPVVSSDSILAYKIPYNEKMVRMFNELSIIEIISNNIQETQILISLQDWILPMLMNGQVTIAD